jgi:mycothiol synthase
LLQRAYDLRDIFYLWKDRASAAVAWSLFSPNYAAFDLFVHPRLRHSADHEAMLDWTEARAQGIVLQLGGGRLHTMWIWEDDHALIAMLRRRGYAPSSYVMRYMLRSLHAPIPDPVVPAGFHLRHAAGESEVEARVEVHRAAFHPSRLTVETWRALMQASGYDLRLDTVTVAPDGRLASFALGWLDAENRIGEFEPVGTAPAFQRRGLGKAAILGGLHQMKALGAASAVVYVEEENTAAVRLYESAGFRAANRIHEYVKAIEE